MPSFSFESSFCYFVFLAECQNLIWPLLLVFCCDGQLKKWRYHWFCPSVPREFFKHEEFQECFKKVCGCLRKALGVFRGRLKAVSRAFQRNSKSVSGKLKLWYKEVSSVFQLSFKDFVRKIKDCVKEVSRKFQQCFKKVLRVFQGGFMGLSWKW